MDPALFDIIACPVCKGELKFDKQHNQLVCCFDRLAFDIKDDIPVLLEDEAHKLTSEAIQERKL